MMYDPVRDDYDNWKEDWGRRAEWLASGMYRPREKHSTSYVIVEDSCDMPWEISYICYIWKRQGKFFRENDKPCVIWSNGDRIWAKNQKEWCMHREDDKPAKVSCGMKHWFREGKVYFPFDSIKRSLVEFHNVDIVSDCIGSIVSGGCLTYEFQKLFCDLNPLYVNLIPSKFISGRILEEYYGHYSLGEIGL